METDRRPVRTGASRRKVLLARAGAVSLFRGVSLATAGWAQPAQPQSAHATRRRGHGGQGGGGDGRRKPTERRLRWKPTRRRPSTSSRPLARRRPDRLRSIGAQGVRLLVAGSFADEARAGRQADRRGPLLDRLGRQGPRPGDLVAVGVARHLRRGRRTRHPDQGHGDGPRDAGGRWTYPRAVPAMNGTDAPDERGATAAPSRACRLRLSARRPRLRLLRRARAERRHLGRPGQQERPDRGSADRRLRPTVPWGRRSSSRSAGKPALAARSSSCAPPPTPTSPTERVYLWRDRPEDHRRADRSTTTAATSAASATTSTTGCSTRQGGPAVRSAV